MSRTFEGAIMGFLGDSQFSARRLGDGSWHFDTIDSITGKGDCFRCNDQQAGAILALFISGGFYDLISGEVVDTLLYKLAEPFMPITDDGTDIVDGRRLIP